MGKKTNIKMKKKQMNFSILSDPCFLIPIAYCPIPISLKKVTHQDYLRCSCISPLSALNFELCTSLNSVDQFY